MGLYRAQRNKIAFRSQSRTMSRIPVEIWHEILDLATTVEDGDEFGQSDVSDTVLSIKNRDFKCFLPLRKERQAFQSRLSVILVCQLWYAVALRFLWSHLRLELRSWLRRPSVWIALLESDMWPHVQRLDILYNSFPGSGTVERKYIDTFHAFLDREIFPRISQLQVLSAPYNLTRGRHALKPKVVLLHPADDLSPDSSAEYDSDSVSDGDSYFCDGPSYFWMGAHLLDLNLETTHLSRESSNSSHEEIIFPHLVRLCIRSIISRFIVSHITTRWKIPQLEALTLQAEEADVEMWLPLLIWASGTIKSLHLSTLDFDTSDLSEDEIIHLPFLTSLVLEHCFRTGWAEFLRAPLLAQISFRDASMDMTYRRYRSIFAAILTEVLESFPACTALHFYASGHEELIEVETDRAPHLQDNSFVERTPYQFSFNPADSAERALAVQYGWLAPLTHEV